MKEIKYYKDFDFHSCDIVKINTKSLICIDLTNEIEYQELLKESKTKNNISYITFTTNEILLLLSELERYKNYNYIHIIKQIYLYKIINDRWLIQLHIFNRLFKNEKIKKFNFLCRNKINLINFCKI